MPNYKYTCSSCNYSKTIGLPISCDPKKIFCCDSCYTGNMTRRIIANNIKIGREVFGDWYKKQTGKELFGG